MGTSYVDYRGSGFWSGDAQAEVWLHLLAQEAGAVADPPAWLVDARDCWELQATAGFTGCVSPCLDTYLGADPDRVAVVVALSQRVRRRLLRWAPAIPREVVNGFGTGGPGSYFTRDLETDVMLPFADAFLGLLRGEVSAGPATPSAPGAAGR